MNIEPTKDAAELGYVRFLYAVRGSWRSVGDHRRRHPEAAETRDGHATPHAWGVTTLMLVVCLLTCVVPTWRALAVQPAEVLRDH